MSNSFKKVYEEMNGLTLVSEDRCKALFDLAQKANNLEGDIAEIGVYKGGTAKLLALTCTSKDVCLFDTFQGMPPKDDPSIDMHKEGDFNDTSLEAVQSALSDCENVKFYQGTFPDTIDETISEKFSLVHSDVDLYQCNIDVLEYFYPRMVDGGIIVFDDYEWKGCPGIKKSLDKFLSDKPEKLKVSAQYQCYFVKGSSKK